MKSILVWGFVSCIVWNVRSGNFWGKSMCISPYPQELDILFLQQMCTELQGHFRKWEPDVQIMWWESIQAKGTASCKGLGAGGWCVQLRKGTSGADEHTWLLYHEDAWGYLTKLLASPKKINSVCSFLTKGGIGNTGQYCYCYYLL